MPIFFDISRRIITPVILKDNLLAATLSGIQLSRFASSQIRYNFNKECEDHINLHIALELFAGYFYLTTAFHFDQGTVALPGFHKQFLHWSEEEFKHAHKLMYFQNKRGGQLSYASLSAPPMFDWTPCAAITESINLEKTIMQSFDELHCKATKHADQHLCDFIESEYLIEQYAALHYLQNLLTNVNRVGDGEGLFILDQQLLRKMEKDKHKYKTND